MYCVSFRIAEKTVGGRTYSDRYNDLTDYLYDAGQGYWAEMTSFILVDVGLDTESFARKAAAHLSKKEDMLFVFDPQDMSACYFGAVTEEDVLKSFFPRAKKL